MTTIPTTGPGPPRGPARRGPAAEPRVPRVAGSRRDRAGPARPRGLPDRPPRARRPAPVPGAPRVPGTSLRRGPAGGPPAGEFVPRRERPARGKTVPAGTAAGGPLASCWCRACWRRSRAGSVWQGRTAPTWTRHLHGGRQVSVEAVDRYDYEHPDGSVAGHSASSPATCGGQYEAEAQADLSTHTSRFRDHPLRRGDVARAAGRRGAGRGHAGGLRSAGGAESVNTGTRRRPRAASAW